MNSFIVIYNHWLSNRTSLSLRQKESNEEIRWTFFVCVLSDKEVG